MCVCVCVWVVFFLNKEVNWCSPILNPLGTKVNLNVGSCPWVWTHIQPETHGVSVSLTQTGEVLEHRKAEQGKAADKEKDIPGPSAAQRPSQGGGVKGPCSLYGKVVDVVYDLHGYTQPQTTHIHTRTANPPPTTHI